MAYLSAFLFSGLCRFLCLLGFFCSLPSLGICDESARDRQALLCFKSGLSAPAGVLASWSNASMEFCNWHGITCSATSPRRVVALDLESQAISGTIAPCVAKLTWLARLQLFNNTFHGGIPSELGLLSRLTNLNLSNNALEGFQVRFQILLAIFKLKMLEMDHNKLSGRIPASIGRCTQLARVNLSYNSLNGK
ncbi:hypothetical protein ZWY2020_035466 [Hordeum vulgare]|nr:hypothetical protein ZWY2020_035466 [Hordeum vulgare]